MRINLSVTPSEYADLLKVAQYQEGLIGIKPGITSVAKACMNSGLQVLLSKVNNPDQVESSKVMKRPKR